MVKAPAELCSVSLRATESAVICILTAEGARGEKALDLEKIISDTASVQDRLEKDRQHQHKEGNTEENKWIN